MSLNAILPDLTQRIATLRRDLHAHPELAFSETRTSALVAERLQSLGIETHVGLAGTGVVGWIKRGTGNRAIGLRADMDALPLPELNTFPHRSRHEGRMHACGHDGHTAMLLGAAEALATLGDAVAFDGTVYFIFQPAEEHEGGGRVMVEEGLFERFPMQMVFGLHNWPGLPAGSIAAMEGPIMAGADRFEIKITARGAHAAMPHQGTDAILAGSALVQALQSLVSRATDPQDAAVVSVTRFHAGHADNILPEQAILGGTVRSFQPDLQDALEEGMARICTGIEATYRVQVDLDYDRGYPPTLNASDATFLCREAARQVVSTENVYTHLKPSMGAEDFSYLSRVVPGCYVWLGNGPGEGGCMLHSPHYDFNDKIIETGIRYWVRLVEKALAPG
jgi:hippurate hydrolase